jgi:hypothetical protein
LRLGHITRAVAAGPCLPGHGHWLAQSPEPGDSHSPRWPITSGALATADRRRSGTLSAKTVFEEILDNDEASRLFCSEVGGERAVLAWHGPNHSPDNIFIHP